MLSRNVRSTANRASRAVTSGQRSYSSFDRDFYYLTSALTRDFNRGLSRRRDPWSFFDTTPSLFSEPAVYYHQPVRSTYEHKTITSDENGHVTVKTQRKVPGRPWETHVEEYTNGKSLEQNKKPEAITDKQEATTASQTAAEGKTEQQTIEQPSTDADKTSTNNMNTTTQTAPQKGTSVSQSTPRQSQNNMLSLFDQHFQQLSDSMMRDFDDFFGMRDPFFSSRNSLRWSEPDIDADIEMIGNDNNTTYHAKTVVNNNGHVTVKTVSKQPGSAWETSVKHYGQDGALVEGQEKPQAIGGTSESQQKVEKKTDESVQNEQKSNTEQAANSQ